MTAGRHQLYFINGIAFMFMAGIFCAERVSLPLSFLYGAVSVVFIYSTFAVYGERKQAGYGILLLFFLLGILRYGHATTLPQDDIGYFEGSVVTIKGRICDFPNAKEGREEEKNSVRYVVKIAELSKDGKKFSVSGKLLLYTTQPKMTKLGRYGDRVEATGEVRKPRGYQNPGQIDSAAALRRQGITANLYAGKSGVKLQSVTEFSLLRTIDEMRRKLLACMEEAMSKQDAAALFAMLFGGYAGIRPELLEAFTATGIVHILSVSGSHITMLSASLECLGRILRLRRLATIGMIITAVVIYALFSGCVPPVIRSAAMGILTFAAMALDREKDARRILALIALAMLAAEPELLYDLSFQLSFAATAGLLYLAPIFRSSLRRFPEWVGANLAITLSAQLAVLPFLAWYFHTVSLSALLANLVAVPLIEFMVIGGLTACVIGIAAPLFQKILLVLCSLSMGLVYNITKLIASIPGGSLYLPSGGIIAGSLYYVVLFLSFWCFIYRKETCRRKIRQYGKCAIVVFLCGISAFLFFLGSAKEVRVHFIDVGQGEAMLLITPHDKAVLIDTGGILSGTGDFDVGARVVVPYLYHYGIRDLEYLILTHAHDDHAGGASAVRRKIPVRHIIVGREDRREYARVFKTSLNQSGELIPAYTGQTFRVDGVALEIVRAAESDRKGSGNEVSNVIRISYGSHSFLITGDLDAAGERAVLESGTDIQSTVLKVAHHGSKTSSTEDFIAAAKPAYAVISVGADNRFGHPAGSVVQRLAQHNVRVLRTDLSGAIVFRSNGEKLKIETFNKK